MKDITRLALALMDGKINMLGLERSIRKLLLIRASQIIEERCWK